MSARIVHLREAGSKRNATSEAKGRGKNEGYWTREHLTEAEMDKLLAALKRNRHGHRDWLIGLLIERLSVSPLLPNRPENRFLKRHHRSNVRGDPNSSTRLSLR